MDTVTNKRNMVTGLFGKVEKYNLIDLLTLKAIVSRLKVAGNSVAVFDISFRAFAFYWNVSLESLKGQHNIHNLNDLRGKLIAKYGLSLESSQNDIFQILNYAQDKSLEIKLLATVKPSLNLLSQLGQNKAKNQTQSQFGLMGNPFFKLSNSSIQVNLLWQKVVTDNYSGAITEIEIMIDELLFPETKSVNDRTEVKESVMVKTSQRIDLKAEFKALYDIEKRISLQMNLNRKQYSCLEEAFFWLNVDNELFTEIHELFTEYIRKTSFKSVTLDLPLVTVLMLLYSAVYLYNDDEFGGFWNGFFGTGTSYNYQRDVALAMNCLDHMVKKYKIDNEDRHYMEKRNLSEIFSHIYLPEISLKKMFSALYRYYFRNRNHHLFNKAEFLEVNKYKLDKPGLFFLGDDGIIKDVFESIIELLDDGVSGKKIPKDDLLPKRFYDAFDSWMCNEKTSIDHSREEYYISSPHLGLDYINECIYLSLSKQKSRSYSDEDCGWEISIDNQKSFVQGRIIRQQDGAYLVLDEKIKINEFHIIKVSYVFNNKKQGEWTFNNDKEYLIFDKAFTYQKKTVLKRDKCYLAFPKDLLIDHECVIERSEFSGWNDYIVYNLDLTNYQGKELQIKEIIRLQIDDEPAIKKSEFKLLFESWEVTPVYETVNIYEYLGTLLLTTPFIDLKDIHIYYYCIDTGADMSGFIKKEKISGNKIRLTFNENIPSGSYNVTVKYKNRTCYRDSFIIDHETKVAFENLESYEKAAHIKRNVKIEASQDVEIISNGLDTKVEMSAGVYSIETITGSIANFIYKKGKDEILIRKIVKPVKYEVVGLDELLETRERQNTKEITKEVFSNHSVGLYVKNLDNKYEYLIYELLLIDEISNNTISDVKKLKLGETCSWDFKGLSDRLIEFKNIKVVLNIKDTDHNMLFSTVVLHVIEHIRIYDLKTNLIDNVMKLSWKESQVNKRRNVTLYNITAPQEPVHVYEIDDGITELEVDLNTLSYGAYTMIVGYRKEESLFDSVETTIEFFEREKIKNVFINKHGMIKSKGHALLTKYIWLMFREKYESIENLIRLNELNNIDAYDVFLALIQMYYLTLETERGTTVLLKVTFGLLNKLLENQDANSLLSVIIDHKEELENRDLSYIVTAILSLDSNSKISKKMIDDLSEIDLVSALCAVQSGTHSLSRNMIMKCRESFDVELLAPGVIKNHDAIFGIIKDESELINGFWNWLIEHRNNYLLKYNYSKARLFRMFEIEKELSTNKVAGRTIDDMVDNLINGEQCFQVIIANEWQEKFGVEKEVYEAFNIMIQDNISNAYKDILSAAFISVAKLQMFSKEKLFDMSMRCHLSNRSDMYNRYRAYLKLIFI